MRIRFVLLDPVTSSKLQNFNSFNFADSDRSKPYTERKSILPLHVLLALACKLKLLQLCFRLKIRIKAGWRDERQHVTLSLKFVVQWLTLLLRVRKVSGSNLGPEGFRGFPQSPRQMPG
jgi:hypothetical protein